MNRIFSVVWNCSRRLWVVGSEWASHRAIPGNSAGIRCRVAGFAFAVISSITIEQSIAGTAIQINAIGNGTATGTGGTVPATASAFSIAIGGGSGATATNISVAIGDGSSATGNNSVALGRVSVATGANASALGYSAEARGANSTATGFNSLANATDSTATGATAVADATNATAYGAFSHAAGVSSIAIGGGDSLSTSSQSLGTGSIAMGASSIAYSAGSVAVGQNATAGESGSTTIINSTAVGDAATASGNSASAFGNAAFASGESALALGHNSSAQASNAIAIGTGASVSSGAADSVAIGTGASALGSDSVAIGLNATASTDNSLALGNGSTTGAATATSSGVINGTPFTYAGGAPVGVASVGSAGAERQITNVAAGRVTGASTDAINGSQLFATNSALGILGTTVTGVNTGLNNIVNNGTGIKYFHSTSVLADSTAAGTNSVAIGPVASASAVNAIALGNGAGASTANSLALGNGATTAAATATPSGVINGTTFTYAGAAPVGVASVGAVGAERQITNVAAGRVTGASTDAINGSQLLATNSALGTLGTTVTGINTGLNNIVNNGTGIKYFHSNSVLADSTATGTNSVAIGPLANASAVNAVALGDGAVASTANSLALGNGATTAAATGTPSGVINGTTFTYAGAAPVGVLSVGAVGAERQITNVAAGRINGASTDAINGSQLFATNTALGSIINNGSGVKYFHSNSLLADSTASGVDSVAAGPLAVSSATNAIAIGNAAVAGTANSIALGNGAQTAAAVATSSGTLNGVVYNYAGAAPVGVLSLGTDDNERQISHVAAGQVSAASTDAINGSQLFATNSALDTIGTGLNNIVNNGTGIKFMHSNSALGDSSSTGTDSLAIGPLANASATNAVAIGNGAVASTANSVAIGNGSTTAAAVPTPTGVINGVAFNYAGGAPTGVFSVGATGAERQITNVAAGQVTASSTDAVNGSQLFATNSSLSNIINNGAGIKYFHSNSVLADSSATGLDSVAVGPQAAASAANAIAIGSGSIANTANSVALGSGAATSAAVATSSSTINGVVYNYAGSSPMGVVSLGTVGNERQITNVAAGRLSAASSDAINGSQLFATNTAVDGLGTTVNGLTTGLNNIVNNGTGIKFMHSNSTLGDSTSTGTDSLAIGPLANASAANTVAIGNGAVASTANSVAMGNGSTTAAAVPTPTGVINGVSFNYAGGVPTGVFSVGAPGVERQITNVAAGQIDANSTDAINGSQLFATNSSLSNIINNGAGIKYFHSNSVLADSSATGLDSIAVGPQAAASASNAIAVGNGAVASTANSIALGNGSTTATAVATPSSVINGVTYNYTGGAPVGVVSVGIAGNDERQITNVAAGQISATSADAINGSQLFATNSAVDTIGSGLANIVNGAGIKYLHSNSTLGDGSATGTDSLAIGPLATASATNSVALGSGANASVANSMALGSGATTTAAVANTGDVINGASYTYAGGAPTGVVSFGSAGNERQLTNLAAGQVTGASTDAVNGSQLFATNTAINGVGSSLDNIVNNGAGIKYFHSNSLLADSSAVGLDSVAIGPLAVAGGVQSMAAGSGATSSADGSLALGNLANAQVLGGVALGQGSVMDRAIAPVSGSIPAGNGTIIYDTADASLLGAVSVGRTGAYRQITNVADGTEAHDAVTLRQLTGAMGSLSSTGTLYFHANSSNPADALAGGQESIAVGPATVVNGENGIGIGNQATVGLGAPGGIAIGRNSQVLLASGVALGTQAQAQGEQALALGAGATASQAMSVALGASSVTTVGAQTGYTAYRLAVGQNSVGEVGVGTALGNRKITGVAAGSADNDAVNVAQLVAVGDQVDLNTDAITGLGGRVTVLEGTIVGGAGVKYFHSNSTAGDSVASGTNAMAAGPTAQASGTASIATGNNANAAGNGAVAVGDGASATGDGSVALGQGASDNGRGAETYTGKYSNANNVSSGTVSVGNAATGQTRTLSNVADGQQANDAVNVRQLDGAVAVSKQYTDDSLQDFTLDVSNLDAAVTDVDKRVTTVESTVSGVQNGTDGMFQVNNTSALAKPSATGTNAVAGGAGSVASATNTVAYGSSSRATAENATAVGTGAQSSAKNAVALGANSVADRENTVSVGNVGTERQITNVAAGTSATDAVNVDQLSRTVSNITAEANGYTDQRYSELKRDLNKQDDILSAGIAGAMAMASLPQPYTPGASMTSIGAGNYRGQSSLSFGVSRISDNGRWVTKLQASTNTQGDAGIGVGVGYQW